MSNSRFNIKAEDTSNTSRTFGKMSLNVYKPGFIDTVTTEAMKMAIDRELGEISKALFQTAENTSAEIEDAIGDVDFTEIKDKISELEVKVDGNTAAIVQESEIRKDETGKLNAKWGVQTNVNGKVSGIVLNNDGASSSFEVVADRFSVSDGTNSGGAPFEIVGGVTKIKNAAVGTIHSDNWNGSTVGWAITKDGFASFNNVTVRGHVEAASGTFTGTVNAQNGTFNGTVNANAGVFNNVTIAENCNILGTVYADKLSGDIVSTALLEASTVRETLSNSLTFNCFNINTVEKFDRVLVIPGGSFLNLYNSAAGQSTHPKVEYLLNGNVLASYDKYTGVTPEGYVFIDNPPVVTIPAGQSGLFSLRYTRVQGAYLAATRDAGKIQPTIYRSSSVFSQA